MYLHGSFMNRAGDIITVHILTENKRGVQVEIGSEESGVYFSDNPVEISSSVNGPFDHLLRSSASIRLQTRSFIPELFCLSALDAVVNIYRGDECIFAGFIEPQAYDQDFNSMLDELELNCIDALSALQYSKYRGIGTPGHPFAEVLSSASTRTFKEIISDSLEQVGSMLDIVAGQSPAVLYDGCRAMSSNSAAHQIFDSIAVSELIFLGEDEDDAWTREETLEAVLKYLNLHILQQGLKFYIFSWETLKESTDLEWLAEDGSTAEVAPISTIEFTSSMSADCGTSISIDEVFNQLKLRCKIESIDTVIESPLEDSAITSPFCNKQKYVTEYSADGEGVTAYNWFASMINSDESSYDGGSVRDWYIQVKDNPNWKFYLGGRDISEFYLDGTNQQNLLNDLATQRGAALIAMGDVDRNRDVKDNSLISKIDMVNYLVISVNGNGSDSQPSPSETQLKAAIPCAVYQSNVSGGVFSPADNDTTNYIVLSGKLVLNPRMEMTGPYPVLKAAGMPGSNAYWHQTVYSRTNDDGRYYTRKYYNAISPNAPVTNSNLYYGFIPFSDEGPKEYLYQFSEFSSPYPWVAPGIEVDQISKFGVLACMLIIGDKCVVETINSTSGDSKFSWVTYKTREECASDDEYYQQSFTIGVNPKLGDYIIGQEYDIQNNISYEMGIEAEGTAIPIRKSDHISGAVKFIILGPINSVWNQIVRRHPTFFRDVKWTFSDIPILAHVSNILVKEFEAKIYSDNGMINNWSDEDLVYISDTDERFVNEKDDIEFDICSGLTTQESQELGVPNTLNISTAIDVSTGDALLSIYDCNVGVQAKPEQIYVDAYYSQLHRPRITLTQSLEDGAEVKFFRRYCHPALPGRGFYVETISRNLIENTATLTLKEIPSDSDD